YGLKDIENHVFEVDMRGRALSAELFEGVANFAQHSTKLSLGQFNRYWLYDALCQIRHFGLHVEGCIDHFRSLLMCGLLPCPVLIRLALTVLWLPALPAHQPRTRHRLDLAPHLGRCNLTEPSFTKVRHAATQPNSPDRLHRHLCSQHGCDAGLLRNHHGVPALACSE